MYQFQLISLLTFINTIHGRTDSFTFKGTYEVTISGEERRLSVCENKNGMVFWGLSKLLSVDVDLLNYVYAIGIDSNGIQKKNLKGKQYNIYEAEGESLWFKENELGIRTIQYYLRYNENKKYLKYTLSTANFEDDTNSINNIYALEKVSEDVLGECFMAGEIGFDEMSYPLTLISDSITNSGLGDNAIQINTDKNNTCFGTLSSDLIIDGGVVADGINTEFKWDNKLRISQGTWTNPCCQRHTSMVVSEFYDNYEYYNSYLTATKCEGSNLGFMLRYYETDEDWGECPLFEI